MTGALKPLDLESVSAPHDDCPHPPDCVTQLLADRAALTVEVRRERAAREAAEHRLYNLLAVVHRDGGHYTGEHGDEKATEDAMQIVSASRAADRVAPPRVIVCAARIAVDGPLVHDQVRELILSVPAPGRHHNVSYLASRIGLDHFILLEEQGFLLSDGTYADRQRAHTVAKAAGQIIQRCGGDERTLYSENLW